MIHSLFPAFFRLFYVSQYAPHIMTMPTKVWDSGGGGGAGSFTSWGGPPVDASVMIEAYVDTLLPFFTADVEFTQAIVYTMDDEVAPPRPRAFIAFTGKIGTSILPVNPAAQSMYTFRTVDFGLLKVVLLDAPVTSGFLPINVVTPGSELAALSNLLANDSYAFSGRDNAQPSGFVHATFKLNDELRKSYRLS